MPRNLFFLVFLVVFSSATARKDFLSEQKKYPRVRQAFQEKGDFISGVLATNQIQENALQILLIAYKSEQILELYAKNKTDQTYTKIANYRVCEQSGELGPKSEEGDGQVPEGFYYIDRYNPASTYYLSLGVNYPNQADRIRSKATRLGGNIFVHGQCVTIGCLPMTDEKIKEIYLYAIQACQNGQKLIPMYIFPFRMNQNNMQRFEEEYADQPELLAFWKNLKTGYDLFLQTRQELKPRVATNGKYYF